MATVKKGVLTHAPEWWRYLRPYNKRYFWKRERRAARRDTLLKAKNKDEESPVKGPLEDLQGGGGGCSQYSTWAS